MTKMLGTKKPEAVYEFPEGDLEKIERLLKSEGDGKPEKDTEEVEQQPVIKSVEFDIKDKKDYILLGGKTHESYEYPSLLISKYRLSYNPEIKQAADNIGLNLADTAKEANGRKYIGNIQWNSALKLNLCLNRLTLNSRQYIDFINLLRSGKAFNGEKNKIDTKELENILKEILELRDPWRSEWLDADFKYLDNNGNQVESSKKGDLWIYNNHILDADGNLIPKNKEKLKSYLMEDCKIDLSTCNKNGMPMTKGNDINYGYPRKNNNSVAGFFAVSSGAGLDCCGGSRCSYSGLGVRSAKIFEE